MDRDENLLRTPRLCGPTVQLANGKPDGEPFLISSGTAGGSWITIDRNMAVWNGATSFMEGPYVVTTHSAIIACELPLPGAKDIGDVDQDGRLLITDAALILNYLFLGSWKPRLRLADVDGTGEVAVSDAIKILEYLFLGGTLGN